MFVLDIDRVFHALQLNNHELVVRHALSRYAVWVLARFHDLIVNFLYLSNQLQQLNIVLQIVPINNIKVDVPAPGDILCKSSSHKWVYFA